MKNDIINKIQKIVSKGAGIDENDTRSLMILIRKLLELMSQFDKSQFLTLHLYCNWVAHIEITQSNTGLRILAEINDTLVTVKDLTDTTEIQKRMSSAIGFSVLRKEISQFLQKFGIDEALVRDNSNWAVVLTNLIEIIRDVPLSFPQISQLDKTKQKIYTQIVKNPIKPGAGVISAKISLATYPPPTNQVMSLFIKTEDTTTVVIPLLIDVSL